MAFLRDAGVLPPPCKFAGWFAGDSVDIVHANEPHALTSAWLARAHRSVPVIASRRIALPLSPGFISLARYRAAARIVAVSHFVEKSVIESGLPSGLRRSDLRRRGNSPGNFRAQTANVRARSLQSRQKARASEMSPRLCPRKDMRSWCGRLPNYARNRGAQFPGCILLLCGEGPEQARLQELARQLQASRRGEVCRSRHRNSKSIRRDGCLRFPVS